MCLLMMKYSPDKPRAKAVPAMPNGASAGADTGGLAAKPAKALWAKTRTEATDNNDFFISLLL